MLGKKTIRTHVCDVSDTTELLVLKVKLTTLIGQRTLNLNLLVRALDGEVRHPSLCPRLHGSGSVK